MSGYNSGNRFPVQPRGVVQTTSVQSRTHEGGVGYLRTPRSELFLTAITEMAEDTFYESAEERQARISTLIKAVLHEADGREWLQNFLPWLRNTAQMRSAPVILLAEMAAAGAKNLRPLVASTLARADEPGELLAYWLQFHGRSLPAGLKRGIADSAVRLYTERNALKYDGQSKAVRFGDVLDMTHPVPSAPWQSDLFKQLIDNRHNRNEAPVASLALLLEDYKLQRLSEPWRRGALSTAIETGWSWERLAGWLPGGMDSEAWEAVIPNMGYMALLRNLRNFENAGVDQTVLKAVSEKLSDPEEVAKSRQFPYRFLTAYLANQTMTFGVTLETALEHSLKNVPNFPGRTLVLVDTSGSMEVPLSDRSKATRTQVAALFGIALAKAGSEVDVVLFATDSMPFKVNSNQSTLRLLEQVQRENGKVGYGTQTHQAINRHVRPEHTRVVILTDEQSHDSQYDKLDQWVHVINLAGYRSATMAPSPKVFTYGGFTDAMFKLMPLMEAGAQGRWPWQDWIV